MELLSIKGPTFIYPSTTANISGHKRFSSDISLTKVAYCVAGITSCFIATFTSVAAIQGIRLTKLNVNTECIINFAKTFDVANEAITEGINFEMVAESENADKQKLQELVQMAEERCPAMYSMTHEIKVKAQIK